jgi:PDZ domain-containing protein
MPALLGVSSNRFSPSNFSKLPRLATFLLLLFFGAATVVPLPYVLIKPGSAQNVMDEMVKLSSSAPREITTYPSDGKFLLLSVMVTSPGSQVIGPEILYNWMRSDYVVIPRSLVYRAGNSPEKEREIAKTAMVDSQRSAKIAAINYLKSTYEGEISSSLTVEDIAIAKTNTGGPSGGMIYALGVIELFTSDDLLQGRIVAGTGTIDTLGQVGSIGGVSEKIIAAKRAGATLFLLPRSNCEDVESIPEGITIAAVSSLTEAILALNSATPRGCASVGT